MSSVFAEVVILCTDPGTDPMNDDSVALLEAIMEFPDHIQLVIVISAWCSGDPGTGMADRYKLVNDIVGSVHRRYRPVVLVYHEPTELTPRNAGRPFGPPPPSDASPELLRDCDTVDAAGFAKWAQYGHTIGAAIFGQVSKKMVAAFEPVIDDYNCFVVGTGFNTLGVQPEIDALVQRCRGSLVFTNKTDLTMNADEIQRRFSALSKILPDTPPALKSVPIQFMFSCCAGPSRLERGNTYWTSQTGASQFVDLPVILCEIGNIALRYKAAVAVECIDYAIRNLDKAIAEMEKTGHAHLWCSVPKDPELPIKEFIEGTMLMEGAMNSSFDPTKAEPFGDMFEFPDKLTLWWRDISPEAMDEMLEIIHKHYSDKVLTYDEGVVMAAVAIVKDIILVPPFGEEVMVPLADAMVHISKDRTMTLVNTMPPPNGSNT